MVPFGIPFSGRLRTTLAITEHIRSSISGANTVTVASFVNELQWLVFVDSKGTFRARTLQGNPRGEIIMNGPSIPTGGQNPYGCAGMAALLFASSPTIALGLVAIAEFQQRQGKPTGGGPVGIGVPPIWYLWLILLLVASPWFLAGILLLRRNSIGRWIAVALTIPSALIAVLTGIGTFVGLNAHDSMTAMNVSVFSPIALGAMLFCLTVWVTECTSLSNSKKSIRL